MQFVRFADSASRVGAAFALPVFVLFAAISVQAEDASVRPGATEQSDDNDLQISCDAKTKPFEFRSTHSQWPLVPASDASQLSVTIRSLPEYAERNLVLVYQLIRVDDGAVISREQTGVILNPSGDSESILIASSAPERAGVYEIRCRLIEKPDKIWSRFTRSSDDLATVKTPWLVYENTPNREQGNPPDSADDVPLTSQPQWRKIQKVGRIDPNDWKTPAWIPESATSLVPNVKRVSESLSLTPWRDASHSSQYRISPGGSFVGYLPELETHQPYQLSMVLGEAKASSDASARPLAIRVEFARSSAFDSVTQTVDLSVQRALQVSATDLVTSDPGLQTVELLHYATAISEFVRVINQSTGKTVVIDSITLSQQATEKSTANHQTKRKITLETQSANWIGVLSPDYGDLQDRGGYSVSTAAFFRLWKSTSRLSFHSRWCGYDQIVLNRRRGSKDPAVSPPADLSKWAHSVYHDAFERWTQSNDVPIILSMERPTEGKAPAIKIGQHGFSSTPSFQLLDSLARKNPAGLLVPVVDFPMNFNLSIREAIEDFKLMSEHPVALSLAASAESDHIQFLVGHAMPSETGLGVTTIPVTIINAAPWASKIRLQFMTERAGEISVMRSATNKAAVLEDRTAGVRVLSVPPSSISNFEISGGAQSVRLKSWDATMVGGEKTLAVLKNYISEIVAQIGTLALPEDFDQLRNGGFEVEGQVGIVGWMHTQFPSSAVTLDSKEAIEGSNSIRMTADAKSAGRTWLVSELIPAPASGRLAVSLATRANVRNSKVQPAITVPAVASQASDAIAPAAKHRVRVSLEGDRLGKAVRFSVEFEVPCDGQWQSRRIVLETDQVRAGEIDSLRLTVDSLTPGKLWIDDIHVHDYFPTRAEQSALQGRAFLAIQGLQRGHLKPAAQLLGNEWSKFLLAGTKRKPVRQASEAVGFPSRKSMRGVFRTAGGPAKSGSSDLGSSSGNAKGNSPKRPSPKVPSATQKEESVAQRLRDWLPRSLRF